MGAEPGAGADEFPSGRTRDLSLSYGRLPGPLVKILQRAHTAELAAAGPRRRPAYRVTRELLGGAIGIGYTASALADCLGTTAQSVRTRASRDGWVAATTIQDLADIGPETIAEWRATGLLPNERRAPTGESYFPAVDVIWAVGVSDSEPDLPLLGSG
jgi:hypothetical protein